MKRSDWCVVVATCVPMPSWAYAAFMLAHRALRKIGM